MDILESSINKEIKKYKNKKATQTNRLFPYALLCCRRRFVGGGAASNEITPNQLLNEKAVP